MQHIKIFIDFLIFFSQLFLIYSFPMFMIILRVNETIVKRHSNPRSDLCFTCLRSMLLRFRWYSKSNCIERIPHLSSKSKNMGSSVEFNADTMHSLL